MEIELHLPKQLIKTKLITNVGIKNVQPHLHKYPCCAFVLFVPPANFAKMETDELINLICDHLEEVNTDDKKRLERIKELQEYLAYNQRLTDLSENEKIDFVHCVEGYPLSDNQRRLLDDNPLKQDYYISMWARSTYFRRCSWLTYLHGESEYKPAVEIEAVTA